MNIETIRTRVARRFAGVFSAPYLPDRLVWTGLILAGASLALVLLGQPPLYWMENSQAASDLPFLSALLKAGPVAFLAVASGVLALAWALTTLLTRRLALIAWTALTYVSLAHLLSGLSRLLSLPTGEDALAGLVGLAEQTAAALLVGAALSIFLFRRPAPATEAETARPPNSVEGSAAGDAETTLPVPAKRRLRAWQAILAAAVVLMAGAGAVWIISSRQAGWRMIKPAHSPGNRTGAAVAYDPAARRALLFGGGSEWLGKSWAVHNDLWAWDGSDWSQVATQNPPPARFHSGMAFDEQRGVLVLFGGDSGNGLLNDTWEWDGVTWTQRYSSDGMGGPTPRGVHLLYYDPNLQKIVVAGGYGGQDENKKNIFFTDTWSWDGRNWAMIDGGEDSPFLASASAAYDPSTKTVMAMNFDGMLAWSQDHWARLAGNGEPNGRQDARMAAIPSGVAIFGGSKDDQTYNDLWLYTSAGWQNPDPALKPGARVDHAFFYDPVRASLVVFGGFENEKATADMWEYPIQP